MFAHFSAPLSGSATPVIETETPRAPAPACDLISAIAATNAR